MTQSVIFCLLLCAVLLCFCMVAILLLLLAQCKEKRAVETVHTGSYLLVYASQSGMTKAYAEKTAQQLQKNGKSVVLLNIQKLTEQHLLQAHKVLWMVSTYGEGDSPDTAQVFQHSILTKKLDLSHQQFAVLAFGDRRYTNFCAFGHAIHHWLCEQNAQAWFDVVMVDQASLTDLNYWNSQLNKYIGLSLDIGGEDKNWQTVTLTARTLLNAGSIGTGLYQILLDIPETMTWKSGDILEIQCCNSTQALTEFQQKYPQLTMNDIQQLKYKNLLTVPIFEKDQAIAHWLERCVDLPIREYSIASIPQQHQIELVVRQEVSENGLGLGSGLLTQYLHIGDQLNVCVRSNPTFHLINSAYPLILIGNGSGIAGLLSHIRQREQWGCKKNWLIFGERQKQYDAVYHSQLLAWKKAEVLPYQNFVYSRDHETLKYVQDVLIAEQDQLKLWLSENASIYVCGSLKGMAKDVDTVLINILGKDYVDMLKKEKRYQRDVY